MFFSEAGPGFNRSGDHLVWLALWILFAFYCVVAIEAQFYIEVSVFLFHGCNAKAVLKPFFLGRRHAIDQAEPYSFLDKAARVRTFTIDGLSLSLDSPNFLVVIEFEGGGKMMTYLVDCKKEDIRVGMAVRPSYRKMYEANGVQTYFWKVVPAEEAEA